MTRLHFVLNLIGFCLAIFVFCLSDPIAKRLIHLLAASLLALNFLIHYVCDD